ncbi:MAG: hypothetical protein ACRD2W_09585 [Acidimicrobiales bacterium]
MRRAVRILVGRQRSPDEPIGATEGVKLAEMDHSAAPVLVFLSEVGLLDDDRVPAIVTWVRPSGRRPATDHGRRAGALVRRLAPGEHRPPRSRPRAEVTIRTRTL